MKRRIVIHACRYEADIIETQAEADFANQGFEPHIDGNGVKHPLYSIGDDVDGWDLVEEDEVVGLPSEFEFSFEDYRDDREAQAKWNEQYDKEPAVLQANEAWNKVAQSTTDNDKKWTTAKFGAELLKPWIKEQFEIDGDEVQIREILDEWIAEARK